MMTNFASARLGSIPKHVVIAFSLAATMGWCAGSLSAATFSWNTLTTGLWTNGANWDSATPSSAPANSSTADTAVFNKSGVNGGAVVQLGAATAIGGITVANTGLTSIASDSATLRTLTVGSGGITLNAGAGGLVVGATGTAVNVSLAASQSWTNNSANALAITGSLARAAGTLLTITGTGAGGVSVSAAVNTNGILGPWATVGTGTAARFAVVGGGGAIQAFSGGTAAATAASVTDTSGTVNYDVAAVGTLGAGASFNTLRYTGAVGTTAGAFTANGLMNVGSGQVTFSGTATIGATRELAVWTGAQGVTLSGVVRDNAGGASSILKSGTGAAALVLSGSNSYSGGTVLSGGNLTVSNGAALGTGAVTLNAQARTMNINTTAAIANAIVVDGGLGIAGQGLIDTNTGVAGLLTGTITLNGTPTVGGHFGASSTGSLTVAGPVNATVPVYWARSTGWFGGGGSYSNMIVGKGTVGLTATNGLSTSATLSLAPDGDAVFDLAGYGQSLAGIQRTGTFAARITNSSTTANATLTTTGTSTYTGSIQNGASRSVALLVNGGQLTLSASNAYTGGSTVSAGTLVSNTTGALGSGPLIIDSTAKQVQFASVTVDNPITINGGLGTTGQGLIDGLAAAAVVLQGGTITINATPTNGGHFGSAGSGSLTVNAPIVSSVPVIWARNRGVFAGGGTYGAFTISRSSNVILGATNGLSTAAVLTVGNAGAGTAAVFDLAGFRQSLVGIVASGTAGSVVGNSSTTADALLTLTGTSTYGGEIRDSVVNPITSATGTRKVAVTVAGGALTLSGTSTYTGATTVQSGRLIVNGALSGASAVDVAASAFLGGSGVIGGPVSVSGTLSPGNSPGLLTVATLALGGSSTTLIEINSTTRGSEYDAIDIGTSGGLAYGGVLQVVFGNGAAFADNTTFDVFAFTGAASGTVAGVSSSGFYAGTWNDNLNGTFSLVSGGQTLTFSQATGDIVVVPEPATLALAAAGIGMMGYAAWKRRRQGSCSGR